jgi:hypothetical protein
MEFYLRGFCRDPFTSSTKYSFILSLLVKEKEMFPHVVTSCHCVCICIFSQSLNQQVDWNEQQCDSYCTRGKSVFERFGFIHMVVTSWRTPAFVGTGNRPVCEKEMLTARRRISGLLLLCCYTT